MEAQHKRIFKICIIVDKVKYSVRCLFSKFGRSFQGQHFVTVCGKAVLFSNMGRFSEVLLFLCNITVFCQKTGFFLSY